LNRYRKIIFFPLLVTYFIIFSCVFSMLISIVSYSPKLFKTILPSLKTIILEGLAFLVVFFGFIFSFFVAFVLASIIFLVFVFICLDIFICFIFLTFLVSFFCFSIVFLTCLLILSCIFLVVFISFSF
jgi:hypothetical protein